MSKPLKEDYIIRIKSRIEQHVKEPVEQEEKEEFVELMTRGQFVHILFTFQSQKHIIFTRIQVVLPVLVDIRLVT